MIDFRYHVVSLVAVFLALATGIIIGGFSLRGEVADQLNAQVAGLRNDKSALQAQLNQANAGTRKRDDGVGDLAPKVLAGSLSGQRVAVVALPGVDSELVAAIGSTVSTAGGKVTTNVSLDNDWTAPTFSTSSTMRDYASKVGITATDMRGDRLAGAVLGRALVRDDEGAKQVLNDLAGQDSTTVNPKNGPAATSVVVVWPGMQNKEGIAKKWSAVVSGIGISIEAVVGVSSGSVSSGDGPVPDELVSSVRETPDVVSVMSTVDDGSVSIGQIAVGLALRDEIDGKSGQYGMGRGASAVIPRVVPENTDAAR